MEACGTWGLQKAAIRNPLSLVFSREGLHSIQRSSQLPARHALWVHKYGALLFAFSSLRVGGSATRVKEKKPRNRRR